ncbi:hypothetical protein PR048_020460 [Dryococelus australis]|uniref:Tc1-like transposase DDE domain-containing protein n=1 Tax=Dryococelus australis TaxID=614101 RepID=A0ABQ9H6B7_9NEOP|nr:hypothetical protein PR048_020460 [Dryococelus australis]
MVSHIIVAECLRGVLITCLKLHNQHFITPASILFLILLPESKCIVVIDSADSPEALVKDNLASRAAAPTNRSLLLCNPRAFPADLRIMWQDNSSSFVPLFVHVNARSPSGTGNVQPLNAYGAAGVKWLDYSLPTQANQARFPVGSGGFSHLGILPDDSAGRWAFSGISRFPSLLIPSLLHTYLASLTSALNDLMLRAAQISSLTQCFRKILSPKHALLGNIQYSFTRFILNSWEIFLSFLCRLTEIPLTTWNNFNSAISNFWGCGSLVVRLLASHQGESCWIPDGVIPGFSHVGIVVDDAAGRLVFSGISRFPRHFIPALLRTHLTSPSSVMKTSIPNLFLPHSPPVALNVTGACQRPCQLNYMQLWALECYFVATFAAQLLDGGSAEASDKLIEIQAACALLGQNPCASVSGKYEGRLSGVAVRALASYLGERGLIPGGATLEYSHLGIVAGRTPLHLQCANKLFGCLFRGGAICAHYTPLFFPSISRTNCTSTSVDLCFTAFGVGPLVFVRGSMNTEAYCNILGNEMLSTLWRFYGMDPCYFQDDNASCHVSRATMQWHADNNVRRLDWPAQSPDFNPIKHLWDELDRWVRARQARPKSISQLMEWLREEWRRIPVDVLQTLVESVPDRVAAVIATKRVRLPCTLKDVSINGRTMRLVTGSIRELPLLLSLHSGAAPYSTRFTRSGSQDLHSERVIIQPVLCEVLPQHSLGHLKVLCAYTACNIRNIQVSCKIGLAACQRLRQPFLTTHIPGIGKDIIIPWRYKSMEWKPRHESESGQQTIMKDKDRASSGKKKPDNKSASLDNCGEDRLLQLHHLLPPINNIR